MSTLTNGRARGWTNPLAPIVRRFRNRDVVRRLRQLDDHLLSDIGLTRGEIESIVAEGRP